MNKYIESNIKHSNDNFGNFVSFKLDDLEFVIRYKLKRGYIILDKLTLPEHFVHISMRNTDNPFSKLDEYSLNRYIYDYCLHKHKRKNLIVMYLNINESELEFMKYKYKKVFKYPNFYNDDDGLYIINEHGKLKYLHELNRLHNTFYQLFDDTEENEREIKATVELLNNSNENIINNLRDKISKRA